MTTLGGSGTLLLSLATTLGVLRAQTPPATGTGLVTNANGAAVRSVRIELTNTDTNLKCSFLSSENGHYVVPGIQNGPYILRAIGPGFAPFVMENIQLVERDTRRIDVQARLAYCEGRIESLTRPAEQQ